MLTALLLALAQDPAALIPKLASKDAVEAAAAKADLLALGEPALKPLRAAAAVEADVPRKKLLVELADRLETRGRAAGLKGGELWYAIFKNDVQIGWAHLKSEEKDGRLQFSDEIFAQASKDVVFSVKAAQLCAKDEYLRMANVTLDVATPDTTVSATAKVKEDRLILQAGGETRAQRIPANTVTDLAVLRLVGLLPATEEYSIELLQLIKPQEPSSARLRFEREETVQHDGRPLKTKRWLLSDGSEEDRTYWVDADGRLVKALFKDAELVLSTEAKAKDIDTK